MAQQVSQKQPRAGVRWNASALWGGKGRPFFRWRTLVGAVFHLVAALICYQVALWFARWGWPTAFVGVGFLFLCIFLIWKAMGKLWEVVAHLGLRGLLLLILLPAIGAYIFVGLSLAAGLGWQGWRMVATLMLQQTGEQVTSSITAIRYIPDDLSLAFLNRGASTWFGAAGTDSARNVEYGPTSAVNAAAEQGPTTSVATIAASEAQRAIIIGSQVQVVGTGGASLRAREQPGQSSAVVVRFAPGAELEVLDGPATIDGVAWWRVQGEEGEGWCSSEFLAPLP